LAVCCQRLLCFEVAEAARHRTKTVRDLTPNVSSAGVSGFVFRQAALLKHATVTSAAIWPQQVERR
jgi:hypothetical protein